MVSFTHFSSSSSLQSDRWTTLVVLDLYYYLIRVKLYLVLKTFRYC